MGNEIEEVLNTNPRPESKPSPYLVNIALIVCQILFGGGAVIGKLGLADKTNPILFALIREGFAGPILLAAAVVQIKKTKVYSGFTWRFFMTGFALFANQCLYIIGLKLSSSTTAAIWQPSIPIFTCIIAIITGLEPASILKLIGVLLAALGAALMIAFGPGGLSGNFLGNLLFVGNCTATALYVIWTKPLLKQHLPLFVTGVSYMSASCVMCVVALIVNTNDAALDFVCPDCDGSAWEVPNSAIAALVYWILFQSVIAYFLMTWGNKYADASLTAAYSALQPLTAAILSVILIATGVTGLDSPGLNDLGALGIVAGLAVVVYDSKRNQLLVKEKEEAERLISEEGTLNNSSDDR